MRCRSFLAAAAIIGGCSTPPATAPSLAPRAAEAIDPRLPVVEAADPRPVNPALAMRLAALIDQAKAGDAEFRVAAVEAERLAAGAGSPQSESWIVAQQAISAAVAARAPTARALGDVDATAATALATTGDISPADRAAIEGAAAEVGAIDRRQSETLDSLRRRVGN